MCGNYTRYHSNMNIYKYLKKKLWSIETQNIAKEVLGGV